MHPEQDTGCGRVCRHSPLSEDDFHHLADETLDTLCEALEQFVEDCDIDDSDVQYSVSTVGCSGAWRHGADNSVACIHGAACESTPSAVTTQCGSSHPVVLVYSATLAQTVQSL